MKSWKLRTAAATTRPRAGAATSHDMGGGSSARVKFQRLSRAATYRGLDGNAQHQGLVPELREGNLGCREKVHTGHRMFVNRGWNSAGQSG